MKKIVTTVLCSLLLTTACSKEEFKSNYNYKGNHNPVSADNLPEQNLLRAMQLTDAAVENYFEGNNMTLAEKYNPYTDAREGTGSVWVYTSCIEAVNAVIDGLKTLRDRGDATLYKKKWAAGDPEAQYQNMVEMFSDLSSPENILVKQYSYPTMTHGLDAYSSPYIFRSPLSAGTCPTLDFLELFDGFDRYDDGTVRVTDGVSNAQGNYLLYDSPMDFFKNAEPRLRAYVIFPGDQFKSQEIEVRAGVYTGSTPIKPFFSDYSYNSYETPYEKLSLYTDASNKQLYLSPNADSQQEKVEYNGSTMTAAGANGPFYNNGEATVTGLYLRKYLKDDPSFTPDEGKSDQPFILMRYAEVMLNAAEAAVELALAGEPSPDGSDLMQVATDAVNEIRERAGAELLESNIQPTTEGRNIVRKERRKELAFEHKTKWDLRRWRVWHYEGRDGFWGETRDKNTYSNNASYRFRGLYPFFSTQAGKWFFDAHFHWVSRFTPSFSILDYYFAIPSGEVSKSSYIDQQPNR